MTASWLLIGLVSAIAFLAFIQLKPAQKPQILAIGLLIAALSYVGFAIVGNASPGWIAIELAGVGMYSLLAVMGLHYCCPMQIQDGLPMPRAIKATILWRH